MQLLEKLSKQSKISKRNYEPTVISKYQKADDKIEISVKDNGNGIPQKVLDKIFQPFFTTKPTGQGTGLGLSLSYDIVKAHGGELRVETKEGEGCEFVILQLSEPGFGGIIWIYDSWNNVFPINPTNPQIPVQTKNYFTQTYRGV